MKSKWPVEAVIGLAAFAALARADDTGFKNPATAVGLFTNPTNVFASDNLRAVEGTVGDTMACYDFNFNVPADAVSINGILIESEMNATGGTAGADQNTTDIRLSWNGGTSWTAFKSNGVVSGDPEVYYGYGGAADTWGRTWTVSETGNANFRMGITYALEDAANMAINIDHVRAKIFYTPASGGGSPRRNRLLKK